MVVGVWMELNIPFLCLIGDYIDFNCMQLFNEKSLFGSNSFYIGPS